MLFICFFFFSAYWHIFCYRSNQPHQTRDYVKLHSFILAGTHQKKNKNACIFRVSLLKQARLKIKYNGDNNTNNNNDNNNINNRKSLMNELTAANKCSTVSEMFYCVWGSLDINNE